MLAAYAARTDPDDPLSAIEVGERPEPEVPDGQWYKRFSGMTVCGEGELIKTFLLLAHAPKGREVR